MKKNLQKYAKILKISDIGVCEARVYNELDEILCKYDTPFTALPQKRISPFEFVKNARSVIMCVFNYYQKGDEGANLSRYAWGADYHEIVKNKLEKLCEFLKEDFGEFGHYIFCDNSPLCDKHLAYLAGLGIIGKNHLLIHPKYGSYVFIGGIVTELDLPYDTPLEGGCSGCGKCQESCPGDAFNPDFDARRCASYIMQKKGELSKVEENIIKLSGKVWGCDICADVCPHNRCAIQTDIEEFYAKTYNIENDSVKDDIEFFEFSKGRAFAWRGRSAIKRNLDIWGKQQEKK